jgi:CsoR family transcriptional regulator, copper-sensing transcriptional repressor
MWRLSSAGGNKPNSWHNPVDYLDNLDNYGIIFIPLPLGGGYERLMDQKHQDIVKRLKSAEGHLRGIQRMLDEGSYCIDVIRQVQAVQAALNKISAQILEEHLNSCVITAINGDDPKERERVLREITDVFEAATKV